MGISRGGEVFRALESHNANVLGTAVASDLRTRALRDYDTTTSMKRYHHRLEVTTQQRPLAKENAYEDDRGRNILIYYKK
ncbi:hypothetical protein ACRALDRAFT_207985 [Sodiomyces alcalophilus JCM 7366]|uniref:uncharacterized protein n=1 Tax=Sodiomyces alcalophilus JCM 7366 TaxID=591952 RepID=UPI0039B62F90